MIMKTKFIYSRMVYIFFIEIMGWLRKTPTTPKTWIVLSPKKNYAHGRTDKRQHLKVVGGGLGGGARGGLTVLFILYRV